MADTIRSVDPRPNVHQPPNPERDHRAGLRNATASFRRSINRRYRRMADRLAADGEVIPQKRNVNYLWW